MLGRLFEYIRLKKENMILKDVCSTLTSTPRDYDAYRNDTSLVWRLNEV